MRLRSRRKNDQSGFSSAKAQRSEQIDERVTLREKPVKPETKTQIKKALMNTWFRPGMHTTLAVALALVSSVVAETPKVIGMLEDFRSAPEGLFQQGFLDSWRWTEEFRQQAREWSRIEVVASAEGRALRVRVDDARVFTGDAKSFLRLAPFYPPEADAVRLRVRVLSGQCSLYVGGPTAYYGNSDVFTEPQTLRAEAPARWVEVLCRLNHPTWRNFRRSGFSTDAPRNYYNRWAQEPLGVFLAPDTKGVFLIERIELVALGEGKPFPRFSPQQMQPVRSIATFEDGRWDQAFTLYMAAAETEWFDESWRRTKPLRFEPMKLSVVDDGLDGRRSLKCHGRTAEEVHCAGVHTEGAPDANAISASLRVDAPAQRNTLVGAGPVVPVDFLVFTSPDGKAFPWERFAASAGLRAHDGLGFEYNFTYRGLATLTGVHFAIYQTRRYLQPGEWTHLVLPAADFTCIYGHGSMRERYLTHQPLRSGEVIAVAWLNPWCRAGVRDEPVTTRLDTLTFVRVPGKAEHHRSFWQVPEGSLPILRDETVSGLRTRHFSLPEDPTGTK